MTTELQMRVQQFQVLIRQAEAQTGITVASGLTLTTPGGTKINTPAFELEDGTTINSTMTIQAIDGWQPPLPTEPPVTEELEDLLSPPETEFETPDLSTEFDWVALGLDDAPDFIGPNAVMNQPLATENGKHAD